MRWLLRHTTSTAFTLSLLGGPQQQLQHPLSIHYRRDTGIVIVAMAASSNTGSSSGKGQCMGVLDRGLMHTHM